MVQAVGKFQTMMGCRGGICGMLTGVRAVSEASSQPLHNAQKESAAFKTPLSLLSSRI